MAFIPVTNAAQVTLQYSQSDGSFAENEWWVQRTGAWTDGLLTTMAEAFIDWWQTGDGTHAYQDSVSTAVHLVQAGARDNTTVSSPSIETNVGLPVTGSDAVDSAALGLSFALTARTGLAGRSFRGRTFLVGLGVDQWADMENNIFNSGDAAVLVLAFNALISAVTAADAEATLVVCSRFTLNPTPPPSSIPRAAGVTTPITSYGFHDLLTDFQRRRAPGHNRHH